MKEIKKIRNKKTFYAVGLGAFYSEKINFGNQIKTIVYDCGSLNKERLIREISQSDLRVIDYLVISHFHKDHINGIEELKKHSVIKNVIIPKIDQQEILFYLNHYSKKTDIEYRKLILTPKEFFNKDEPPKIITVDTEGEQIENIDLEQTNNISHKSTISLDDKAKWIFKFYVDKGSFAKVELEDKEKELINSIKTIKDYDDKLEDLKLIYKKITKGNINLTSMSMVSAPFYYKYKNCSNSPISIMNGDIMLNDEKKISEFTKHFSDFKQCNFSFHIPHHGSHKNLKRPINEWIIEEGIIMSGHKNNYGHPSSVILRKFSDAKIPTKVLTEDSENYVRIDDYLQ